MCKLLASGGILVFYLYTLADSKLYQNILSATRILETANRLQVCLQFRCFNFHHVVPNLLEWHVAGNHLL